MPLECARIDEFVVDDDNGRNAARWDTIPKRIFPPSRVVVFMYLVPTITVYCDAVVLIGFRLDEVLRTPTASAEFEVFRGYAYEGWNISFVVVTLMVRFKFVLEFQSRLC